MGGKRQKFPNMGWLVKLHSFKTNETYFEFSSCLKRQPMQLLIISEVIGTLGGRLNISLAVLFKTD